MNFFDKKSFQSVKDLSSSSGLNKNLGAFDLIMLGLGSIIGTGVFVFTGIIAAKHAGPAVMLSYTIAGVSCIFVALSYTELAAMLPTSGSIYTYSYVAFGESIAWLMGSIMIMELGMGAAVVAAGWSGYMQEILSLGGFALPDVICKTPSEGGMMDLPALFICLFIGVILYLGTKDSKMLNMILVFVKMAAIAVFIYVALPHFDEANWDNFMPFGFQEVLVGASALFFAYTGFGGLATAAEECKNPKRDLTIGIIGSLVIAVAVYVVVAGLLTGIVPFTELNNPQAMAYALKANNSQIGTFIVAAGAVCGMTTVIMMQLFALSRIFYVIGRDGLLPKFIARVHPKYDSPHVTITMFAVFTGLVAAFSPTEILGKLVSVGALIDYMVVSSIVILFRFIMPDAHRPFRCPIVFVIAPVAIAACGILLFKQVVSVNFELLTVGKVSIIWLVISVLLYLVRKAFVPQTQSVEG